MNEQERKRHSAELWNKILLEIFGQFSKIVPSEAPMGFSYGVSQDNETRDSWGIPLLYMEIRFEHELTQVGDLCIVRIQKDLFDFYEGIVIAKLNLLVGKVEKRVRPEFRTVEEDARQTFGPILSVLLNSHFIQSLSRHGCIQLHILTEGMLRLLFKWFPASKNQIVSALRPGLDELKTRIWGDPA